MKSPNYLLALCILFSAFLFSCSKSSNPVSTTTTVSYSSMDTIFSMLNVQPKTLMVDAVNGGSFYGNSGTRYVFYPNSFQSPTGANVTGTVQVQVAEYLQRGDMLFSKMLPISNNEPLISGGEINVVATQNGQSVYLRPHSFFTATIPQTDTASTGMEFFSGRPTLDTTTYKANWVHGATDSSRYNANVFVTSGTGDSINILSDSLKFCNADKYFQNPNYQSFTVAIVLKDATLTTSSTVFCYAFYDQYKGVWALGFNGKYLNGVFTENHVPNIPVHFVAMTVVNGKFYGGVLATTPATGMNYTITLSQIDPMAFKTSINQL